MRRCAQSCGAGVFSQRPLVAMRGGPHSTGNRYLTGQSPRGMQRTIMAKRAVAVPHDLITTVPRGLRQLPYRHDVLGGRRAGTGLMPATMTTSRIERQ